MMEQAPIKEKNEEAVDRVLHGLSARSVPGHLQHRTLYMVQARLAEAESRRRLWMPAGVALGAALTLAAGVLLFVSTQHGTAPAASPVIAAISEAAPLPAVEGAPPREALAVTATAKRLTVTHRLRAARASSSGITVRGVSYPAPPRPLTAQEKLLLQIAQHPTPAEIALLDPVERAKQAALEDAEFAKYVAQSSEASRP
jgi:hypothetical protein